MDQILTKIKEYWDNRDNLEEILGEHFEKFQRNKRLIDLEYIPEDIKKDIIYHCRKDHNKSREGIQEYLESHELVKLQGFIQDF